MRRRAGQFGQESVADRTRLVDVRLELDCVLPLSGEVQLRPRIVARCDDSALMKVFTQRGFGIACVPTVIEPDVATQFGVQRVGRIPKLSELWYLIRPAGRHVHPLLEEIEAGVAGDAP